MSKVWSGKHAMFAAIALIVAALGAANWYLEPDRAQTWIIAMSMMAAIWLAVHFLRRGGSPWARTDAERRFIALCAITAGLLLAASLAIALAHSLDLAAESFLQRAKGVSIGAMLAIIGNALPKIVAPLSSRRCALAHVQSDQRIAGWTFTIAGLIYVFVWLFAAIPQAELLSMVSCAAATLLVVSRLTWRLLRA